MRLGKEKTRELLESVRLELVVNPSITIFELQDAMRDKYGHKFDKNFVAKLKNKIHRERTNRIQTTVAYEIATFEDTCNELRQILWEIVDDESSSVHDKISAMREIRTISDRLLDAMFNAGIFDRHIGTVQGERKLTEEEEKLIEHALSFVHLRAEGSDQRD